MTWWMGRLALGIVAVGLVACGASNAGTGVCCRSNDDCAEGEVCHSCVCRTRCEGNEDCPVESPNCDPDTGLCMGVCPETPCPDPALPNCSEEGLCVGPCTDQSDCSHPDTPNCGVDGLCFEVCTSATDCVNPAYPNCDTETGECFGPCPETPCPADRPNCIDGVCEAPCAEAGDCPAGLPNCDTVRGVCFEACRNHDDCVDPNTPNCNPDSGLCQGPCPTTPCPASLPNCNSLTGLCLGLCQDQDDCLDPSYPNCGADGHCFAPCTDNGDCTHPTYPNCGGDGVCFGPCADHADCTLPAAPNCQLDASALDAGVCGPPCVNAGDCDSPLYPNCDPTPGRCLPPCTGDPGCPSEFWKCATGTGLCFLPECTQDSECNPPTTVCESWFCVPGCTDHSDCATTERCDLVDAGNLHHCEPRDCADDSDCNPPTTVCDTDGRVDPNGGGYCVSGCQTPYDCGQLGYDCDVVAGTCAPHDYGDIGDACGACASGFCLAGQGNLCTDFCCTQHQCPAGWLCRPLDDTTGGSHEVDVCVPAGVGQGMARFGEACVDDDDCRSGACYQQTCRESCCTDDDCDASVMPGTYCSIGNTNNTTTCLTEPTTGVAPLGTLGCGTSGSPGDCRSNMCFTNYMPDTGCVTNADCTNPDYPTCDDYAGAGVAGTTDCVHDMCVAHCCSRDDCPSAGNDDFFCGKWVYSPGDVNVCLPHYGAQTLAEGQACTTNGDCISNFCAPASPGPQVCRRRCCTDAECGSSYPNCALEAHTVFGVARQLNVCQ